MCTSWATTEQTTLLEGRLATYFRNAEEGKLKGFWAKLIDEWFEWFPLGEPSPELVSKLGAEKASSTARARKIKVGKTQSFFLSVKSYLSHSKSNGSSQSGVTPDSTFARASVSKIEEVGGSPKFSVIWPSSTSLGSDLPCSAAGRRTRPRIQDRSMCRMLPRALPKMATAIFLRT